MRMNMPRNRPPWKRYMRNPTVRSEIRGAMMAMLEHQVQKQREKELGDEINKLLDAKGHGKTKTRTPRTSNTK
jgi:hypothetical protein